MPFSPPFKVRQLAGVGLIPVANTKVECGFSVHSCDPKL